MEPGGPDPETEDKVMLKRHRVSVSSGTATSSITRFPLSANTLKAMGPKLTLVAGFSYLKSMVHKLPEDNLENFYINRFGRKLYSMFFEGYTEKLWGRHPSQISADWGAQRVKGLSIMGVLKNAFQKLLPKKRSNAEVETSLIEEFWYPKYGPASCGRPSRPIARPPASRCSPTPGWSRSARPMVPCLPWCTRIPRATAPSFPATSSSPRCRSRTWSTPSTRPAPIPRPLIPSPPRPI